MQLEVGSIVEGKVTGITNFGAFVELEDKRVGMVHISEIASVYVKEIRDHIQEDQVVKVKVLGIEPNGKINLSIKKATESGSADRRNDRGFRDRDERKSRAPHGSAPSQAQPVSEAQSFENMLNKFKQSSDEKISSLRAMNESNRRSASRRTSHK